VTVRRHVEHVMGMPISLALRGRHAADAFGDAAWAAALDVLRAADRVFSTYRADSAISSIGRGEIAPADCPPEVAEVLALGEAARRDSGGAFDVRRGGVLDPSGVVKGWAAERAAEPLRSLPDTDFCLSAGGDVVCRTLDPAAPPWRIGVEDPFDVRRVVAVIPLRTGAVATSGTARRGGHIVDARTGAVVRGLASVTVVGDDLGVVDIDATAAFARGDAEEWLRGRGHRSALVVSAGGRVVVVRP
jgi:thiamine biosynthesis lipoprotein